MWHKPAFRRVNYVLTWVWTAVFLISAGLGLWAQQTSVKGWKDWLNWYIPIAGIFLAFRFTRWYPAQVRAAAIRQSQPEPGQPQASWPGRQSPGEGAGAHEASRRTADG